MTTAQVAVLLRKLVLTYDETAVVLSCSVDTVRRMVARGELRTVRWHHRLVRVPVKTLLEDIERMTGSAVALSTSSGAHSPLGAGGDDVDSGAADLRAVAS